MREGNDEETGKEESEELRKNVWKVGKGGQVKKTVRKLRENVERGEQVRKGKTNTNTTVRRASKGEHSHLSPLPSCEGSV